MIKFLFILAVGAGVLGYNVILNLSGEAINYYSKPGSDRWTTVCQYYTPVRIFERRVDAGKECPQRISVR